MKLKNVLKSRKHLKLDVSEDRLKSHIDFFFLKKTWPEKAISLKESIREDNDSKAYINSGQG